MKVEVKLYSTLRQYRPAAVGGAPHHPFVLELPESATVGSVVTHLGIPDGLLNAASLNGEAVGLETPLPENAKVSLFPPAAGG